MNNKFFKIGANSPLRILPRMQEERYFYINPYDPEFRIDTFQATMANGYPTTRAYVPAYLEGKTDSVQMLVTGPKLKEIFVVLRRIHEFELMIANQQRKARAFKRSKMIYRSKK